MSFDGNVLVNISAAAPPPAGANFGTPALGALPGSLGVGFTERVRFYPELAAAQTDLDAGDIDQTIYDALQTAFSQNPRVNTVAVIRVDAAASPMQVTWTVGGGPAVGGESSAITIDGLVGAYAAIAADTALLVGAGLRAALTIAVAALPITVSGAGADVVVTGDTTDDFFSYFAETTLPFTISFVVDESGLEVASSLADATSTPALSAWYGLTMQSRADVHALETAAWIEANASRLFIPQSASEDIPDAASTTDLGSQLKAFAYARTGLAYKITDDQWFSLAWMAKTLQADPDSTTTTWANKPLSAITPDVLSSGDTAALASKYVAGYSTLKGTGVAFEGRTADGQYFDVLISRDWFTDRLESAVADLLIRVSGQNSKVPLTDTGISMVVAVVQAVCDQGVASGHFTQYVIDAPLASDVPLADKQNRTIRIRITAELAGAIHKVIVDGFLVLELEA